MTKKTQNFKRFISAFLVLVLALSFLPELSVKAEESIIDLVGDSVPATTSTFRNGISYCQTGYLCLQYKYRENNLSDTLVLNERKC